VIYAILLFILAGLAGVSGLNEGIQVFPEDFMFSMGDFWVA
jgi:hypothetical protein